MDCARSGRRRAPSNHNHGHLTQSRSTAAAACLRFDGPLDPQSLPADPPASLATDSSVQIIDIDPLSPEHGKRHLAQLHWQADEAVYWPSNTLAVLPMLGRPLRPKTRYAVVVTRTEAMPKLVAVTGPSAGRAFAVARATATVGRHPTNDFVVDDPRVSGAHLELRRFDDHVRVSDVGSTNGTWLGPHRIGSDLKASAELVFKLIAGAAHVPIAGDER